MLQQKGKDPLTGQDPWTSGEGPVASASSGQAPQNSTLPMTTAHAGTSKKTLRPKLLDQLAEILQEQGMAEKGVENQSKIILQRLGSKSVKRALEQSQPWNVLNSMASHHNFDLFPSKLMPRTIDTSAPLPSRTRIPYDDLNVKEGYSVSQLQNKAVKQIQLHELNPAAEVSN